MEYLVQRIAIEMPMADRQNSCYPGCSLYYSRRFCNTCVAEHLAEFPPEIQKVNLVLTIIISKPINMCPFFHAGKYTLCLTLLTTSRRLQICLFFHAGNNLCFTLLASSRRLQINAGKKSSLRSRYMIFWHWPNPLFSLIICRVSPVAGNKSRGWIAGQFNKRLHTLPHKDRKSNS